MRDDAVLRRALPLGRGLGRTHSIEVFSIGLHIKNDKFMVFEQYFGVLSRKQFKVRYIIEALMETIPDSVTVNELE